jgi:hypothetical protein
MTESAMPSRRYGRIYIGPEPERGPHPGYRGTLELDGPWVHLKAESTEWLSVSDDSSDGWPDSDWVQLPADVTVPASNIDQIQWGDDWKVDDGNG